MQRDYPEVLPLYHEFEIHPAAKDLANPSESKEFRSERMLSGSRSLIGLAAAASLACFSFRCSSR
jgi:hypothetical protein